MTRASSARFGRRNARSTASAVFDALVSAGLDPLEYDPAKLCRIVEDWRANGLLINRKSLVRMIGEIVKNGS